MATPPKNHSHVEDDYDLLKKYLLSCPHLPASHPALKVAVEAIDKEQQRHERDLKLQAKFSGTKVSPLNSTSANTSVGRSSPREEDSVVIVDPSSVAAASTSSPSADDDMMDWQNVLPRKQSDSDDTDDSSFLGKELCKISIDTISEFQVRLSTPLSAIAVVLHAALRSDLLGFSCTGVPEDGSAKNGGFAAPVRDLPKTQILPSRWDSNSSAASNPVIRFRYRKDGPGAVILTVAETAESITVHLGPASNQDPSTSSLVFSLKDHINMDSWKKAQSTASQIAPALHYKSLARLLTLFCRTFDLGTIEEDGDGASSAIPADFGILHAQHAAACQLEDRHKSDFVPRGFVPSGVDRKRPNFAVPTTLDEAFPGGQRAPNVGAFADDLAPAGLRDPRFGPAPPNMGGNLLGPNHPMFGAGGGALRIGGPGSMQPRFDPVYPPGVHPTDLDPTRPQGLRRLGEPNPDHLQPPNSFGNDSMFS